MSHLMSLMLLFNVANVAFLIMTVAAFSGLWDSFNSEVFHQDDNPRATSLDVIAAELVRYRQMKNLLRSSDPLKWWYKDGKHLFPRIFEVAKRLLVIPATSVPSERVFSTAGGIITKKRNALSDTSAADLIFLRENLKKKKSAT
jgi:hypothetical protein